MFLSEKNMMIVLAWSGQVQLLQLKEETIPLATVGLYLSEYKVT